MTHDRIEDGELLFGDLPSCHAKLKRYGAELDAATVALAEIHPAGQVKALGRLEVGIAAKDVAIIAKTLIAACDAALAVMTGTEYGGAPGTSDAVELLRKARAKARGGAA